MMKSEKYPQMHTAELGLKNQDVEIQLGANTVWAREWTPTAQQPYRYRVEFTGERVRNKNRFENDNEIWRLKGVTAGMIPDNTSIGLYMPDLGFSPIDHVAITKTKGATAMEMSASLYYDQWHMECNLKQFMAKYQAEIEASDGGAHVANVETFKHEGYGLAVTIKVFLNEKDVLLDAFGNGEKMLANAYKRAIRYFNEAATSRNSEDDDQDREKGRWWTEQVIVPVLTSGTLAAIVGWLIGRAQ